MRRTPAFLLFAILLGVTAACGDADHSHDEPDGHAHDATGGHAHGALAGTDEPPTVSVTHWTDRSELFMEYPTFVAGETGRSAIHVTDLGDFSPLETGEAVVLLRDKESRVLEFRDGPSRPGIFGVDMKVDQAGVYDMSLQVDAGSFQDVHELGRIRVYAPGERFPAEHEEAEAISFLKEQQWALEFGTAAVTARAIRPGITVPGSVHPRSGGDALLTAPVPGRIETTAGVPVPGTRVRAGATLARIVPRSDDLRDAAGLRAALVEAEQSHVLATQERDRAERLVEARALPARRLDEAKARVAASEARLDAAQERWNRYESLSQSADGMTDAAMFAMRAPFDGVVSEVRFTAGASVEANEPLMRIVDPDRVHLVGAVPETLASEIGKVTAGELDREGQPPLRLEKPLAVNPVIDPISRTAEIRFDLDNREAQLRLGQAVTLRLFVGEEKSVTAIPASAVIDDSGRPVVFVQTGESFERRYVRLGNEADGYVHVILGVESGERVVERGAYLVRLAAMSAQMPSHGHVH